MESQIRANIGRCTAGAHEPSSRKSPQSGSSVALPRIERRADLNVQNLKVSETIVVGGVDVLLQLAVVK